MMAVYLKLSSCFAVAEPFFLHRFYYMLFEFRCVSFIRYSSRHKNHPNCFSVYHESIGLTDEVITKIAEGFALWLRP